jgi:DNA-binding SARP family transcriptional activator
VSKRLVHFQRGRYPRFYADDCVTLLPDLVASVALMDVLADHPLQPILRERLAKDLWPHSAAPQARQSLRQALRSLIKIIGPGVVHGTRCWLVYQPDPARLVVHPAVKVDA